MADVKDLSRERISEIRAAAHGPTGGVPQPRNYIINRAELIALLSMSARCLSVTTVEYLSAFLREEEIHADGANYGSVVDARIEFIDSLRNDHAHEAARSLIDQEGKANEKA